ncbi:MAG TPA: anti-sigma factor domain-containing protein [Clostridia bacterium]|jgi:DNA-binding transcriptional MerR regulator|nr:anti-sigma factor domain-containing protein [Clostridia bacterium]
MVNKGIVLEKLKNKYVVLTPEGVFKTIYLSDKAEIGQEISWSEANEKRIFSWKSYVALATVAVTLIVFAVGFIDFGVGGISKAVAYVGYDLNPSIEMSINQKGKVLTAEGLNEKGRKIVDSVSLLNKQIDKAVVSITDKAIDFGYLNDDENLILISMTDLTKKEKESTKVEERITKSVQKVAKKNNINIDIETIRVREEDRNNAKSQGLSAGKLAVTKLVEDRGISISKEELEQKGIVKTLNEKGVSLKEIIKEIKENSKEKEELEEQNNRKFKQEQESKKEDKKANRDENKNKQKNNKKNKNEKKNWLNNKDKQQNKQNSNKKNNKWLMQS